MSISYYFRYILNRGCGEKSYFEGWKVLAIPTPCVVKFTRKPEFYYHSKNNNNFKQKMYVYGDHALSFKFSFMPLKQRKNISSKHNMD